MRHRATRWNGAIAATLVLVVAGIGARSSVLVIAGALPLVYVVFGAVTTVPPVAGTIEARRDLDAATVPPGEPVTVTLTVRNTGDRILPDVRLVDHVPDPLRVLDGTPRGVATLTPDDALTLSYIVLAKRGTFEFDGARLRARSVSASSVATIDLAPTGDQRLTCRLDAESPPLGEQARGYAGQLATDDPGDGVEFHSTRDYSPGDSTARIDWRQYAKRGELTTVSYRDHRTADVVLVIDAREPCRVVAGPGYPSAVELSAYAATRALDDLSGAGHEIGIALAGVPGRPWLAPGGSREHRARVRGWIVRAADAATDGATDDDDRRIELGRSLPALAPPGTQVLLFSPLLDDRPVVLVETWRAHGLDCGVVAPDVLADNTMGGQLTGAARRVRLTRCQSAGARAVDWRRGTPLQIALDHAFAATRRPGWS